MSLLKILIGTVIALIWTLVGCFAFITNYELYFKYLDTGKFLADDTVSKFSVPSESDFENNENARRNPMLRSLWTPHFFFDNVGLQIAVMVLLLGEFLSIVQSGGVLNGFSARNYINQPKPNLFSAS